MTWLNLKLEDDARWEWLHAAPDHAPAPLGDLWNRSRLAGARIDGPEIEPIVTSMQLKHHQERVDPVLRLLDDVLAPTLGVFAARHFTLLFADADGIIVDQRAGGDFAEVARRVRLQQGSAWDESTRGTNAIGTALAEERPVAVRGAAHFARPNHGLICYAAPVHDPWGDVVGVLDATSFVQQADPLAGAAVITAARALEEALRISTIGAAHGSLVQRLLGRLRDPALIVTPDGRVTFANRQALQRGLPLGPTYAGGGDVFRARAAIRETLQVSVSELSAVAKGQLLIHGMEVEPIHAQGGRVAAYLVVLVSGTAARPSPRPEARDTAFDALVGSDPALCSVRSRARKIARSSLPALVLGETGTGKELLARGIHAASDRRSHPFVPVNCGALTPSILHSELFGYAPGSFTGADPAGREGRIASADGGTLFLDEVAEMPRDLQALFLRFLDDGSYHRVGDASPRTADVRLVCATCRDLPNLVKEGNFRADLYHRIRGICLVLPPLRSRSDRSLLCRMLLGQIAKEMGMDRVPALSPGALARIDQASWPGNVRELRMAMHHALVMGAPHTTLEAWHLPATLTASANASPLEQAGSPASLAESKVSAIQRALDGARGNMSAAARELGVARSTLYRLIKKHGLNSTAS